MFRWLPWLQFGGEFSECHLTQGRTLEVVFR